VRDVIWGMGWRGSVRSVRVVRGEETDGRWVGVCVGEGGGGGGVECMAVDGGGGCYYKSPLVLLREKKTRPTRG
jgi:hypothetical protein